MDFLILADDDDVWISREIRDSMHANGLQHEQARLRRLTSHSQDLVVVADVALLRGDGDTLTILGSARSVVEHGLVAVEDDF
jgi:hypothetical protein